MDIGDNNRKSITITLHFLFEGNFCKFYGIDELIKDTSELKNILNQLEIQDISVLAKRIGELWGSETLMGLKPTFVECQKNAIEDYIFNVPAEIYDINYNRIVPLCRIQEEGIIDFELMEELIEDEVRENIREELDSFINDIPKELRVDDSFLNGLNICIYGANSIVEAYKKDEYYEDYEQDYYFDHNCASEDDEVIHLFSSLEQE